MTKRSGANGTQALPATWSTLRQLAEVEGSEMEEWLHAIAKIAIKPNKKIF
ncbi:hypothetical protein [Lusitaniella coriacea]|uniref:hypothetical protein n=1 Tax=Lusitaniella coriacea TaxID=1983105 RepID=UPI001D14F5DB|nr:hypothetical protein [Lusitaniella coriacea]